MAYTLAELAARVNGVLAGDPNKIVRDVAPLDAADEDSIAFVSPEKPLEIAKRSKAGALLVRRGAGPAHVPTIQVADPRAAALELAANFHPPAPKPRPGVHPTAVVDPEARIGPDCSIGPYTVVESGVVIGARTVLHAHVVVRAQCTIGEDVEIHPNVVLYPHTIVGDRVVLHAGVVLGCDGFGYVMTGEGHAKVPQLGRVRIDDDVEIGANSTVDRGTLGATAVGKGTKLDNLVMVGHNCRLGRHNALAAQAGLAGSCTTGDYVFLGGKAGIADHVSIGDGAIVLANAGVHKDVPAGERCGGMPAKRAREFAVESAALGRLPQLLRDFAKVRRRFEEENPVDRKCA